MEQVFIDLMLSIIDGFLMMESMQDYTIFFGVLSLAAQTLALILFRRRDEVDDL